MHVSWLQVLLDVIALLLVWSSQDIRTLTFNVIRNKQWQWHNIPAPFQPLHPDGVAELSTFWGAIWPKAMANGLLTSQQALRLQVVSHCQAALIRSHNSYRDRHILGVLASGSDAGWQTRWTVKSHCCFRQLSWHKLLVRWTFWSVCGMHGSHCSLTAFEGHRKQVCS